MIMSSSTRLPHTPGISISAPKPAAVFTSARLYVQLSQQFWAVCKGSSAMQGLRVRIMVDSNCLHMPVCLSQTLLPEGFGHCLDWLQQQKEAKVDLPLSEVQVSIYMQENGQDVGADCTQTRTALPVQLLNGSAYLQFLKTSSYAVLFTERESDSLV